MSAQAITPDLFEALPSSAPPRGVSGGPSFDHPARESEQQWRLGWYRHTGAGWVFHPYDPGMFAWLRDQLAGGPQEYGELLDARRHAGFEHPFDVADPVCAHVRYLVLTGQAIEHKRYLGHPDASHPGYRGWHPVFELVAEAKEELP